MDATTIIIILGVGIIQFLASRWIVARIQQSIKHEYDKKLEEYKFEIIQREQASKVGELFAKWIKYKGKEKEILNDELGRDHFEKLNKLVCELAIWIKDESLVKEIMRTLNLNKNALNYKEIVIRMREHILGNKCKELKASELVHFNW